MILNKNKIYSYLAGFFDGEGSISVGRGYKDRTHLTRPIYPRIEIGNTNKAIMLFINKIFPAKIKIMRYIPNTKSRKVYKLYWTKKKAVYILKKLYPYLKIKKPQAKLCLKLLKTYTLQRNNKGCFNKVTKRNIKIRTKIFYEVKRLNRRGVWWNRKIKNTKARFFK